MARPCRKWNVDGAGMRHFRRHRAVRLEELEMLDHRMAGEIDLAADLERLRLGIDAVEFDRRRADPLDALQAARRNRNATTSGGIRRRSRA